MIPKSAFFDAWIQHLFQSNPTDLWQDTFMVREYFVDKYIYSCEFTFLAFNEFWP